MDNEILFPITLDSWTLFLLTHVVKFACYFLLLSFSVALLKIHISFFLRSAMSSNIYPPNYMATDTAAAMQHIRDPRFKRVRITAEQVIFDLYFNRMLYLFFRLRLGRHAPFALRILKKDKSSCALANVSISFVHRACTAGFQSLRFLALIVPKRCEPMLYLKVVTVLVYISYI